jgi:hypothetical protein
MRLRPLLWTLALLPGCAAGEPFGDPGEPLQLGEEAPPVASEVLVDVVTPEGEPIAADDVWISLAARTRAPARCMEEACETWIADVPREDTDVTAYAELCGFLYLEPVTMAGASAVHVTVTADATRCAPERLPRD